MEAFKCNYAHKVRPCKKWFWWRQYGGSMFKSHDESPHHYTHDKHLCQSVLTWPPMWQTQFMWHKWGTSLANFAHIHLCQLGWDVYLIYYVNLLHWTTMWDDWSIGLPTNDWGLVKMVQLNGFGWTSVM